MTKNQDPTSDNAEIHIGHADIIKKCCEGDSSREPNDVDKIVTDYAETIRKAVCKAVDESIDETPIFNVKVYTPLGAIDHKINKDAEEKEKVCFGYFPPTSTVDNIVGILKRASSEEVAEKMEKIVA